MVVPAGQTFTPPSEAQIRTFPSISAESCRHNKNEFTITLHSSYAIRNIIYLWTLIGTSKNTYLSGYFKRAFQQPLLINLFYSITRKHDNILCVKIEGDTGRANINVLPPIKVQTKNGLLIGKISSIKVSNGKFSTSMEAPFHQFERQYGAVSNDRIEVVAYNKEDSRDFYIRRTNN
jgi:hypothetical protein